MKLEELYAAFLKIVQDSDIESGNRTVAFEKLLKVTASTLRVSRVSIWLLDSSEEILKLDKLLEREKGTFTSGIELKASDFPSYFKFFKDGKALLADNAHTNPYTFEFSEVYLKPLDIHSMLDIPIRSKGSLVGVLCCENTVEKRLWSKEDVFFGCMIGELISKILWIEKSEIQKAKLIQSSNLAGLGDVSSIFLHEIKDPLGVILGYSDVLLEAPDKFDENSVGMLKKIRFNAQKIATISNRVVNRVKNADHQKRSFEMNKCIQNVVDLCKVQRQFLNIEIKNEFLDDISVLGSELDFFHTVSSLMKNSAEEIAESKLEQKWIRVFSKKDNGWLHVFVQDSGGGISEVMQKELFKRYFTTKPDDKSSGLGLFICRQIMESNRGKISFEPEFPNTTFKISLPLKGA
jgi:K+-sensing histidine kinase KdpD